MMKFKFFVLTVLCLPLFCFAQEHRANNPKIALKITPDSTVICDYIILQGNDVEVHYPRTAEEEKKIFGTVKPFTLIVCTPAPNVKFIPLKTYLKKINMYKQSETLPINVDDDNVYAHDAVIYLVETAIDKGYIKSDTLNIISKAYPEIKEMRERRKSDKIRLN